MIFTPLLPFAVSYDMPAVLPLRCRHVDMLLRAIMPY